MRVKIETMGVNRKAISVLDVLKLQNEGLYFEKSINTYVCIFKTHYSSLASLKNDKRKINDTLEAILNCEVLVLV